VETEATRCVSDELRAAVKKFAEVDQWEMEFEDGEDDGDDRVVSFSLLTPLVREREYVAGSFDELSLVGFGICGNRGHSLRER
jgi:hypothetical protein